MPAIPPIPLAIPMHEPEKVSLCRFKQIECALCCKKGYEGESISLLKILIARACLVSWTWDEHLIIKIS